MHLFLKFILGIKLYMFRTVSLSITSLALYTQQRYMSYSSILIPPASSQQNLYDMYHCCVYSAKLMMDRGTVRNM